MAAPVLTSLDPTSVDISTGAMVPVTIAGTGFAADDVLMVNGADDLGTFVSDTEFTFSVDTLTASGASTLQIAVRNAAAEVSNELPLELTGETAIGDPDFIPDDHKVTRVIEQIGETIAWIIGIGGGERRHDRPGCGVLGD